MGSILTGANCNQLAKAALKPRRYVSAGYTIKREPFETTMVVKPRMEVSAARVFFISVPRLFSYNRGVQRADDKAIETEKSNAGQLFSSLQELGV